MLFKWMISYGILIELYGLLGEQGNGNGQYVFCYSSND